MLVANDGNIAFTHVVKVSLLSPSIEIENIFHLDNVQNVELAMRLEAEIANGDEFFTDLNGYQVVFTHHSGEFIFFKIIKKKITTIRNW